MYRQIRANGVDFCKDYRGISGEKWHNFSKNACWTPPAKMNWTGSWKLLTEASSLLMFAVKCWTRSIYPSISDSCCPKQLKDPISFYVVALRCISVNSSEHKWTSDCNMCILFILSIIIYSWHCLIVCTVYSLAIEHFSLVTVYLIYFILY